MRVHAWLVAVWMATLVPPEALAEDGQIVWLNGLDGRGRPFQIERLRGEVVAVTFGSRYTREEMSRVNDALLTRASPGEMRVVSVIDFVGIPSMFHRYARRKVAEQDSARVQHLVDERSELRRAFGVAPEKRVDIIVIDRDGTLAGRYAGEKELPAALQMVDALRSDASL